MNAGPLVTSISKHSLVNFSIEICIFSLDFNCICIAFNIVRSRLNEHHDDLVLPQLHLAHDDLRKFLEGVPLPRCELRPGLIIYQAERANVMTVWCTQGSARVETDLAFTDHERLMMPGLVVRAIEQEMNNRHSSQNASRQEYQAR